MPRAGCALHPKHAVSHRASLSAVHTIPVYFHFTVRTKRTSYSVRFLFSNFQWVGGRGSGFAEKVRALSPGHICCWSKADLPLQREMGGKLEKWPTAKIGMSIPVTWVCCEPRSIFHWTETTHSSLGTTGVDREEERRQRRFLAALQPVGLPACPPHPPWDQPLPGKATFRRVSPQGDRDMA